MHIEQAEYEVGTKQKKDLLEIDNHSQEETKFQQLNEQKQKKAHIYC